MSNTNRDRKSRQLVKRLARYTTAAAACGAVAGSLPEKSEADIVSLGGSPFVVSNAYDALSLDMTVGATVGYQSTADFRLGATNAFGVIPRYEFPAGHVGNAVGSGNLLQFLNFGELIGPSSSFASGFAGTGGSPAPSTNFYIGLRLLNQGPLMDTTFYGWAEASFDANSVTTLYRWAYEDSGNSINVGAVPEPSSSAIILLAGGLTSLTRLRRRRGAA